MNERQLSGIQSGPPKGGFVGETDPG